MLAKLCAWVQVSKQPYSFWCHAPEVPSRTRTTTAPFSPATAANAERRLLRVPFALQPCVRGLPVVTSVGIGRQRPLPAINPRIWRDTDGQLPRQFHDV